MLHTYFEQNPGKHNLRVLSSCFVLHFKMNRMETQIEHIHWIFPFKPGFSISHYWHFAPEKSLLGRGGSVCLGCFSCIPSLYSLKYQ